MFGGARARALEESEKATSGAMTMYGMVVAILSLGMRHPRGVGVVMSRTHKLMAQSSMERPERGNVRSLRGARKANPSLANKFAPLLKSADIAVAHAEEVELRSHPLSEFDNMVEAPLKHVDLAKQTPAQRYLMLGDDDVYLREGREGTPLPCGHALKRGIIVGSHVEA